MSDEQHPSFADSTLMATPQPNSLEFRTGKFFESEGPVAGWQITLKGDGAADFGQEKAFLVVDAHQQSFGIRLESERKFTLKQAGSLVTTLRKLAGSSSIIAIVKKGQDYWIPLVKAKAAPPHLWILLKWASPPEFHIVDAASVSLMRKSQQGTYTKKKPLEEPCPSWPLDPALTNILKDPSVLAGHLASSVDQKTKSSPKVSEPSSLQGSPLILSPLPMTPAPTGTYFSPEQREARDRVARRLKTLKKSFAAIFNEKPADTALLERQGIALKTHYHSLQSLHAALKSGHTIARPVLEVTDDHGPLTIHLDPLKSPAQWLQDVFEQARKAKRRHLVKKQDEAKLAAAVDRLQAALDRLRAEQLTPAELEQLLGSLALKPKQKVINSLAKPHEHRPYKIFKVPASSATAKGPLGGFAVHVGKSAMDSDELVKHSRGNDLWLHAVGTTGSHVIIPNGPFSEAAKAGRIDDPLIFAGAVLALHHSKLRDQKGPDGYRGEVYFARRQNIRKRKGMAPGLWQIDKAVTLVIRYSDEDLKTVLDLLQTS